MKKNIVFAYFADEKFIGWYADSFGTIRNYPKIYTMSENQLKIITINFQRKIKKINETTFDKAKEKVIGLLALSLTIFDSEELLRGKEVELRVVECPIYDGLNLDFDKEKYEIECNIYKEKFEKQSFFKLPFNKERIDAIKKYKEENISPKYNNWIYANYNEVKKWAANEPTEFLQIIKS